jgi:hypothetical protein
MGAGFAGAAGAGSAASAFVDPTEKVVREPLVFEAITRTVRYLFKSADASVYLLLVAPPMLEHVDGTEVLADVGRTVHRYHW